MLNYFEKSLELLKEVEDLKEKLERKREYYGESHDAVMTVLADIEIALAEAQVYATLASKQGDVYEYDSWGG